MRQDARATFDAALLRARTAAFPDGEFVGQESFMTATEILALADRAGIGPGVSVLDVCCGVAGPGRLVARERGCAYTGVDTSAEAIALARRRADGLGCRFEVTAVPPVPAGPFDVVMLLETLLAFPDKEPLLRQVAAALRPGGRFACTVEEGHPLTGPERAAMPDADTVWLVPLEQLTALLERSGLQLRWHAPCSDAHRATAEALTAAFEADAVAIADRIGRRALEEMLAAHRLWSTWLAEGRVRKFALVAERPAEYQGM